MYKYIYIYVELKINKFFVFFILTKMKNDLKKNFRSKNIYRTKQKQYHMFSLFETP